MTNRHCLADLWGCEPGALDNVTLLEQRAAAAARAAGATVINVTSHRFEPQGATVVALLAESHLAVHTWPEAGYAGVDCFTCGPTADPVRACEELAAVLQAQRAVYTLCERGELARVVQTTISYLARRNGHQAA